MSCRTIYFDHNSTTPIHPVVLSKINESLKQNYGNASSLHQLGQASRSIIDSARENISQHLGCQTNELIFTSSGTESNNLAIRGVLEKSDSPPHILISSVEHPSVYETVRLLALKNIVEYDLIPVDGFGRLKMDAISQLIRPNTTLVSVMLANNETGQVYPVQEISDICKENGLLFHVDAIQALGKIPFRINDLGCDLLSIAPHKNYGPKGVAALYVKSGVKIGSILFGGHQEWNLRPGTESVPLIFGFSESINLLSETQRIYGDKVRSLRGELSKAIQRNIPEVQINGSLETSLPNTLNIGFNNVDGPTLAMRLDLEGICVSTGSACSAGSTEPSHVLMAMGMSEQAAKSSIRISLGINNTSEEVLRMVEILSKNVFDIRRAASND